MWFVRNGTTSRGANYQGYHDESHQHGNDTVCGGGQVAFVEFLSEYGDLPPLVVTTGGGMRNGADVNVSEYQKGTKEDVECSANGLCNRDIGVCTCLDGFASSSELASGKLGGYGERGDCGFRHESTGHNEKWMTATETLPGYDYAFEVTVDGRGDGARELEILPARN